MTHSAAPMPELATPQLALIRPAVILLAAGRSTRFGAANKLLALPPSPPQKSGAQEAGGQELNVQETARQDVRPLIRRVTDTARAANLPFILLVTGHQADAVAAAAGADSTCHNPDYATGMASSLKAGLSALPAQYDSALVMLGDMPDVLPQTLVRLIKAAQKTPEAQAFVPILCGPQSGNPVLENQGLGKQGLENPVLGNPVLLRRALFEDLIRHLAGDQGARAFLQTLGATCKHVPVNDPGILLDVDTPNDLERRP